ncbi:MAG: hypothetical protein JNM63_17560 [Spirochaetia bacterium]|nr:hypothetical protein [Spirochaetia bacterium]
MAFPKILSHLLPATFFIVANPVAARPENLSDFVLNVDFKKWKPGPYTIQMMAEDWNHPTWSEGAAKDSAHPDRVFIGSDSEEHSLFVRYPKGKVSTEGSVMWHAPIPPREEYFLEYRVRFLSNFEWVKEGKLPGLGGGSLPSGGKTDSNGMTARFLWKGGGALKIYLYRAGQTARWGDEEDLKTKLVAGEWIRLKKRIRLNEPGEHDGQIEAWVNGERVYFRNDLIFRMNLASWKIDTFLFETFYGGGSSEYAPSRDNFSEFADFKVY